MAKTPINLFIDTNIFLDFYRFSKDDLAKLNQLEDLIVKTKDINLIVTSQQVDEFYRNRDKVISGVIKELSPTVSIPQLFSGHPDYKKIKKQAETTKQEIERVKEETLKEAREQNLKADLIIKRLFSKALKVSTTTINKAKRRAELGNPPGKKGSLGDAINWEMLNETLSNDESLHIVSQDGDFASALDKTKLNTFLQKEWDENHFVGEIHLYETLNGLFKASFPKITLMDEYIKEDMIRQLGEAVSFDSSRAIIKKMLKLGSFSENQVSELFKAATTNSQVHGAHVYSPDLIGEKLWEIIKPHWRTLKQEDRLTWMALFPDPNVPDDLPF